MDDPTALKFGCRSAPLELEGRPDSVGPLWSVVVQRKIGGQAGFALVAAEAGHGAPCSRSS